MQANYFHMFNTQTLALKTNDAMNILNAYIRESYDVVTHGEMYPQ